MLALWKNSYDKPRQGIKKHRHYFADKGPYSQSYGFCRSHIQMWELTHTEGWAPKNWCFQTVVLEKLLESPLDSRSSNQSTLKEINPEYSLEGQILKLNHQYFEQLIQRADSLEKQNKHNFFPDAGKDWGQVEKGSTEDKMVGWHHQLNGHEFEQTPGGSERQVSLACSSLWGCKELDTT